MTSKSPRIVSRRRAIAAAMFGFGTLTIPAEGLKPFQLDVGGGRIDVGFASGGFDAESDAIRRWITDAAQSVAGYFGRFPVSRAVIEVSFEAGRSGVFGGVTHGGIPANTRITIGEHARPEELRDDWTMTHEMTHMAFPNVPRKHHWIEEGIATYVEPVARAQAGLLAVEQVWQSMLRDMPKGLPAQGGRGLDQTHSWASTYWGGALFCLLADVQFRERTGNQRGLQHALRGILKAGGNIEVEWPLVRTLKIGDDSVGVPVLMELYDRMKNTPVSTDLPSLWKRLGVSATGQGVAFFPGAELAAIRAAITTKPNLEADRIRVPALPETPLRLAPAPASGRYTTPLSCAIS